MLASIIILLLAQSAVALDRRPDPLFLVSRAAVYGSIVADLGTTWKGMSHGRIELNPILGQSKIQQSFVVGGSTIALHIISGKLYKTGHRKIATWLNFIVAGEHAYAAVRNMK